VNVVSRLLFDLPLPDGRILRLGERTLVMGVLNVTPDSFADGGRYLDPERAVAQAVALERAGADIIDIGGESTRPGAEPLAEDEELRRVLPVIERLRGRVSVPISIDTYKAGVADAALSCGAAIVNDVSALEYDPAVSAVVARRRAAIVLMHTRGRSRDMYGRAQYGDVVGEVARELGVRLAAALEAGIDASRVVLDPGIGFAKRAEHSGRLLAELHRLHALERPILVGPSRKSFLQRAIGERPPASRDWATAAAVTASVLAGAHIVRVHAVGEMVDVVRVADALRRDAGLDGSMVDTGGTG
jgi:dihydropteroate synthase